MTTNTKTPAVTFTPDECALIARAAYAVFDECAYDLLSAIAEEKRKSINAVTVSRVVAIEIALDAGRMEERLRGDRSIDRDLLDRVGRASYAQLKRIVRPAFTCDRYGM